MEAKAKISKISQTFPARKTVITIEIDAPAAEVEGLLGKDLTAVLKPYKKHRSLDANAYYWQLCSKIAEKRGVSKTEMHNLLMSEYGTENMIDGALEWSVKDKRFDWTRSTDCHYRPSGYSVTTKDGAKLPIYWVIRGSHTYDTAEMAKLISGTVYEAKEHGIETLTPNELAKMMAAWRNRCERYR